MRIIAGERRGMRLEPPGKNDATRPTEDKTKEAVFNILQPLRQDTAVLDLFAGTGQIGLEFLSRGARSVVFCEKSRRMAKVIQKNIEKTGYDEQCRLFIGDYRAALASCSQTFDYIYLDPPFGFGMEQEAMAMIRRLKRLSPGGEVIVESGVSRDHSLDVEEMEGYTQIFFRQYRSQCIRIFKESV